MDLRFRRVEILAISHRKLRCRARRGDSGRSLTLIPHVQREMPAIGGTSIWRLGNAPCLHRTSDLVDGLDMQVLGQEILPFRMGTRQARGENRSGGSGRQVETSNSDVGVVFVWRAGGGQTHHQHHDTDRFKPPFRASINQASDMFGMARCKQAVSSFIHAP